MAEELPLTEYEVKRNRGAAVKSAMILVKKIYPKRKSSNFKSGDVRDILNLEIGTHLRNWPELEYEKLGNSTKQLDGSVHHKIHFKLKENPAVSK